MRIRVHPPATIERLTSVADQSSVIRFIQDNWQLGRIGDQSSDANAGTIVNLFDFKNSGGDDGHRRKLILNPDSGIPVLPWRHVR